MALRGTDGTNLHWYSEETREMAANVDEETAARIDALMDPDLDDRDLEGRLGH